MSEWWTYRLSDFLMFSPESYYRLFELYNRAIWPAQIAALATGVAILVLMLVRRSWADRTLAVLLAGAWLFVAWAYFHARYATINLAAPYFAVAFAIEALLLLAVGTIAARLSFAGSGDGLGRVGRGLFIVGLVLPPVLGLMIGREWSQLEVFGIAPDPTVLVTLGVLAAADRTRWELMVVPVLWCIVSGATLWTMRQPDALILPVAAVFALAIAVFRRMERPHQRSPGT